MKTQHETSPISPGMVSAPATAAATCTMNELRAECDRLRETVVRLEKERDAYRRLVYAWANEKLPQEINISDDQEWLPLDRFLPELERIAQVAREQP